MMTIEETIKKYEKAAEEKEKQAIWLRSKEDNSNYEDCIEVVKKLRQLADWLKELKRYRKQIENLIDNESFESVDPFNTYEYVRVVRVADLYDLMGVNADVND